ncbi:MAG: cytochrome c biogenesis protein CcsA [Gammaproteobacteria bacterium]|nr:cytochrome c biogenesis protein CcsA [Gammaproteobacteria bacterium]
MNPIYLGISALSFYIIATFYLARQLKRGKPTQQNILLACGLVALVLHAGSVYGIINTPEGLRFNFFQVASLFGWVIAAIATLAAMLRPVSNLTLIAYPCAAAGILSSLLIDTQALPMTDTPTGVLLHITLSILAYSVLAIAAAQSLLLAALDHQLKHKHMSGIVQFLPPLQTMESLLFEMIWGGLALLTLSIISGMIFIDNFFAQHLAHKTILSISAWCIFTTLLWGRHQLGWRGATAIKGTLSGFTVLMLAYFGSKLVLEVILQRQ